MENKSSLKVNILYNILYQLLLLIVPLITAPYISRVLGPEGMGIYGYTYSIAHYFVVFTMLGILNYGNREISAIRNNAKAKAETFWNIFSIQSIMGITLFLLYLLYVHCFCDEYKVVAYVQSLYILSGILDISWFYFGIEKFKVTTIISGANKILTTICIFLFVRESDDVGIYTFIVAAGVLLNNIAYWLLLNRYVGFSKVTISKLFEHLKPVIILFLPVIAINVYRYISKIMLGAMHGMSDVGVYDAAEKFINLPLGIINAVGTVMLARITSLVANHEEKDVRKYNRISMIVVMSIGFGVAFGLAGISDIFMPLFYGEGFESASLILLTLSPTILFICWANVIRTQYLLPNRKDKVYCYSVIIGAIVNVVANLFLIPRYGVLGAALSTVFAELTVCAIQTVNAKGGMEIPQHLKDSIPFLLIGLFMYAVIINLTLPSPLQTVLLRITAGFFIYLSVSTIYFRRWWTAFFIENNKE